MRKILINTIITLAITLGVIIPLYAAWCEPDNVSGSTCVSGYSSSCNCSTRKVQYCCATYRTTTCVNNNCSPYATWTCNYSDSSYCYDTGTSCGGTCGGCSLPSCNTGYTLTNTGCSSYGISCNRYDDCGVCGQYTDTCYLEKYTVTFNAGTGGYISGTTPQQICRGGNGTQVTAIANGGYVFSQWSDSSTNASRTPTNVTSSTTLTASFILSNQAPSAPTDLTVEGSTNPTGVTDTTPEFTARYDDPNTSDTAPYYEIEVNTNSSFTGTVMWDTGKASVLPTAISENSFLPSVSYSGTGLSLNGTTYYWRIRFWDNSDAVGSWSSTAQFTMNTPPSSPSSLKVEGQTSPVSGVSDITPEFRATHNDSNGDAAAYYEIEVNTASNFGGTVMWDTGQTSLGGNVNNGNETGDLIYAGTALSLNGTTYYWRIRFTDVHGTVGSWSSTAQFSMNTTPSQPTGLKVEGQTSPVVGVTDTTPEFRATHNDSNGDAASYYEIEVNTNSGFTGTVMWDTGQTVLSPNVSSGSESGDLEYAGSILSLDGTTYYWRIRFTDIYGTVGEWSSTAQFTMNTPPNAPSSLYCEGVTTPTNVTDTTPEFSAVYSDANSNNSAYYEIEVNTNSGFTGTVMWDTGQTATTITSGSRSSNFSYAGTALSTNGTTYYWRIRFWDIYGSISEWSTGYFIMRGAPTAPTSLLVDGNQNPQSIASLTPKFSAIYNDPNVHSASAYEIEVNSNNTFTGTVMWDTGKLSTSITEGSRSPDYTYSGTALSDTGTTYYWRIRFWDADDLQGAWSEVGSFVDFFNHQYFKGLQLKGLQLD